MKTKGDNVFLSGKEVLVMKYIQVTKENLEKEHICCAISNTKDAQVSSKKAWLSERFDEGLVFLKSVERGSVLLSISLQKRLGILLRQRITYILIVSGFRVL